MRLNLIAESLKGMSVLGKKMLKRSLVMGALMAFVITGNAWAEGKTRNEFNFSTDMMYAGEYCFPKFDDINYDINLSNYVLVEDLCNIEKDKVMIYANYKINRAGYVHSNVTEGNVLDIDNSLICGNHLELFGCAVNRDTTSAKASSNKVDIFGEKGKIILQTRDVDGEIYVVGGMTNDDYSGAIASYNEVNIDNVSFLSGQGSTTMPASVSIYGGQGRTGHAINNEVMIKNTTIENGKIYGGLSENRGNATNANYNVELNTVTLDKGAIIGENSIVAGGFIFNDSTGNADRNTVTIKGNSTVAGTVYGGFSESGTANNNIINIKDSANVSNASLFGDKDGTGEENTLNIDSGWVGTIGAAKNFDFIYMYEGSKVNFGEALEAPEVILNGTTWNVTQEGNKVGTLNNNRNGKIAFGNDGHLDVNKVGSGEVILTEAGKTADDLNTVSQLTTVAAKMGVAKSAKESAKAKVVMEAGEVVGKTTGIVAFETKGSGDDAYYHGVVTKVTEEINPANEAISDTGVSMKLHWRAHVDDMNKRMGELRDANGQYGVWTRMVRGESEYKNTKAQYNQYQLGYDEKLSVDKRWTVGAAVTFSDGKASYGYGSTEDKSTAFAIYGTKLNNDGTFVDLIARYANLESDVEDQAGKGNYSANGISVSAEVGKLIQQDNGLWIEPQVQLTYGTVDSAEYKIGTKTVEVGDMNSLIGRVGFRVGKDIEKGNVYARASYLYDFEGETQNAFRNDTARRTFAEDLGGGWWEIGVGANLNLSKATYIYADVEKTFGGEVDTNWQWNLGVRYSF